jgi:hypothetical protein
MEEGEPTTVLETQWSPKADGVTELELVGAEAQIHSYIYPADAR